MKVPVRNTAGTHSLSAESESSASVQGFGRNLVLTPPSFSAALGHLRPGQVHAGCRLQVIPARGKTKRTEAMWGAGALKTRRSQVHPSTWFQSLELKNPLTHLTAEAQIK